MCCRGGSDGGRTVSKRPSCGGAVSAPLNSASWAWIGVWGACVSHPSTHIAAGMSQGRAIGGSCPGVSGLFSYLPFPTALQLPKWRCLMLPEFVRGVVLLFGHEQTAPRGKRSLRANESVAP